MNVRNSTNTNSSQSWKDCSLFSDIAEDLLFQLEEMLQEENFVPGEKIIHEGDLGDSLYMIEEGEVAIQKDSHTLAKKSAGEHFGAMALIEDTTRSADVVAIRKTIVKSLPIHCLKALEENGVYSKVLTNHLKSQQLALRNMNSTTIREIKAKLRESQRRVLAGRFIVGIVFLLVSYQFLLGVFLEYSSSIRQQAILELLNPLLIIVVGITAFFMARSSKVRLSEFGLNLRNWKQNMIESFIWTAVFLALIIALRWVLINLPTAHEGEVVFNTDFMKKNSLQYIITINIAYAVLAPVQEFIVRGVIQGSLQKFLSGSKRIFWSILLSNLMFSALHLHNNMSFAVTTLIPGFFWGIMYYRQKSLLGVSISHVIIGLIGLLFLGGM